MKPLSRCSRGAAWASTDSRLGLWEPMKQWSRGRSANGRRVEPMHAASPRSSSSSSGQVGNLLSGWDSIRRDSDGPGGMNRAGTADTAEGRRRVEVHIEDGGRLQGMREASGKPGGLPLLGAIHEGFDAGRAEPAPRFDPRIKNSCGATTT